MGINYFEVMKCQGKEVGERMGDGVVRKLFDVGYFVRSYQNVVDRGRLPIAEAVAAAAAAAM